MMVTMSLMELYLFAAGMFTLGMLCMALLAMSRRADDRKTLADLLADKQAARDAARVKDLELQRLAR
jgi:hypothetical protein